MEPFHNAVANYKDFVYKSTTLFDTAAPTNSNNYPDLQHAVKGIRKMTVNELKNLRGNETS